MIDLLRLCRLYYAMPMPLILLLTIWYASGDGMAGRWAAAVGATAALALVVAGGYAMNDVFDVEVDRVNAPHRPIAGGRVRARTGLAWAIALLAGGLVVAAVFSRWQYLAVLVGVTALLVFYNAFSKRLGIGKQLIVAVLMTSPYALAFAHVGNVTGSRLTTLYIFPVWLFLVSFGYETLKDIRDISGDRLVAVRPTWVQQRPRVAGRVARTTLA
ncbi:MAG: UbiA family prenyltransferase, partial [Phycisphaerae bacterium]|nr:UbiA family prenyltransferase [Phycisphaerae bacterium]